MRCLLEHGGGCIAHPVSRGHFDSEVLDGINPVLGTYAKEINVECIVSGEQV